MASRFGGIDLLQDNLVTGTPAIRLSGDCANVSFENVTITNTSAGGVELAADNGTSYEDIDFSGLTVTRAMYDAVYWDCSTAAAISTLTNIAVDDASITGPARSGIRFVAGSTSNVASVMNEISITNSEITEAAGGAVNLIHDRGTQADGSGLIVTGNNFSESGGINGSGLSAIGFGPITPATWGDVLVGNNTCSDNSDGGIFLEFCSYARVYNNNCDDNRYISGWNSERIGHGIQVRDGQYVDVYDNECSRNIGSDARDSSGAGVAVGYGSSQNIRAWNNIGTGNRIGVSIDRGPDILVAHNVFAECTDYAWWIDVATETPVIRNCVFTAQASETTIACNHASASGSIDEDYNRYYGFDTDTVNHTLGINSATDVDPQLDARLRTTNPALIGAGVAVAGITTDYDGNPYSDPSTIGAFEMEGILAAWRRRAMASLIKSRKRRHNKRCKAA